MTVVLDSNVLLSGLAGILIPASFPGQIVRVWRAGHFVLVISHPILGEVARNLQKPYVRRRLSSRAIADVLWLLDRQATFLPISVPVSGVAAHPEDGLILATAVAAGADYLVIGDTQLQRPGS
jgi:putative PIN family toxin of toxin-antitoxin system